MVFKKDVLNSCQETEVYWWQSLCHPCALLLQFQLFRNSIHTVIFFLYCFGAIFYYHLTSGYSDQQDCVAARSLSSVFTVPLSPFCSWSYGHSLFLSSVGFLSREHSRTLSGREIRIPTIEILDQPSTLVFSMSSGFALETLVLPMQNAMLCSPERVIFLLIGIFSHKYQSSSKVKFCI